MELSRRWTPPYHHRAAKSFGSFLREHFRVPSDSGKAIAEGVIRCDRRLKLSFPLTIPILILMKRLSKHLPLSSPELGGSTE